MGNDSKGDLYIVVSPHGTAEFAFKPYAEDDIAKQANFICLLANKSQTLANFRIFRNIK